jgi:hypothetical protein
LEAVLMSDLEQEMEKQRQPLCNVTSTANEEMMTKAAKFRL